MQLNIKFGVGEGLTRREKETATLLLRAYSNKEIGKELGIAERTAKAYVNALFLKYRVKGKSSGSGGNRIKLMNMMHEERTGAKWVAPLAYKNVVSPRYVQVISLIATGLANKEIAEIVGTTEQVIKNYLRTIYDKVGMWNRMEIAIWAFQPENAVIPTGDKDALILKVA